MQTGSAQVNATGALGGFAIFHRFSDAQEAVVPLTAGPPNALLRTYWRSITPAASSRRWRWTTSPRKRPASAIFHPRRHRRADWQRNLTALPGHGQIAFVLPDATTGFPVTANKRGTVEFDTPASGQISVLGIRNTPQVTAQGTVTTLTTVPALANVGTGGGSFAFIATGGDGWQTTFVLVNAGGTTAPATLKFFDPNGNPLSLPLSFPQTGSVQPGFLDQPYADEVKATLLGRVAGLAIC